MILFCVFIHFFTANLLKAFWKGLCHLLYMNNHPSDGYTCSWICLKKSHPSLFSVSCFLSLVVSLRVRDILLALTRLSGACSGWLPSASRGISADIVQALRSLPASFTEPLFPPSPAQAVSWHAAFCRREDQPPNSASPDVAPCRGQADCHSSACLSLLPPLCHLKSVHLLTKHQTAYYEGVKSRENHSTFLHWDTVSKSQFQWKHINNSTNLLCSIFACITLGRKKKI